MEKQLLDQLAAKRTELARDRTALAMIRTSLALVIAGIGFIGFSDTSKGFAPTGITAISLGIIFLAVTVRHFIRHSNELKNLMGKSL